ncbi:MAG TPA: DM13 domain-containing protein [Candidatus Acidoferrales bacterium]|nr:DM13 domain-containing protein [Candidatus Acidoferrales bacterium]
MRAAAIASAVVIAVAAWVLGSPLFIRTSANEAAPTPAATAPATYEVFPTATLGTTATPVGTMTVARGDLQYVDAVHNGKGGVMLIRLGDRYALRFEDVAITNAPDVHVYLSRETGGKWTEATSLYLGPLKATNGSFNYDVPAGTDVTPYRSVVVWCRAFAVLVTWADLRA